MKETETMTKNYVMQSAPKKDIDANGRVSEEGRKKRKKILIAVIAGLLAIALLGVIAWVLLSGGSDNPFDSSAQEGQAPYKTQEEMQAELDRIVEEGMFNISIASTIEFENGTAEGVAYIENVPGNPYNMQVVVTDDDSGEELYKSGILKPNQYIERIKLEKDLDAGSYNATATFSALDTETQEEIGQAAAKVTLNVLN